MHHETQLLVKYCTQRDENPGIKNPDENTKKLVHKILTGYLASFCRETIAPLTNQHFYSSINPRCRKDAVAFAAFARKRLPLLKIWDSSSRYSILASISCVGPLGPL
jgi:hypothetical protein